MKNDSVDSGVTSIVENFLQSFDSVNLVRKERYRVFYGGFLIIHPSPLIRVAAYTGSPDFCFSLPTMA